jgi:hypothetical protein
MSDFLIDGMEEVNQCHIPNKVQNLSSLELFVGIYKKFSFMGGKDLRFMSSARQN